MLAYSFALILPHLSRARSLSLCFSLEENLHLTVILPLVIDRVSSFFRSCPCYASVRDCAVCAAFLLCLRIDLLNLSNIFLFRFVFVYSAQQQREKAITLSPQTVFTQCD